MPDKINSSTRRFVSIMVKSIILCCIVTLLSIPTALGESIGIECYQNIRAIAIDPNQANVIYAAEKHGTYKSIDSGSTWKLMNNGYPISIEALSINPEDSNLIYAATNNSIYKSNNGGTTWQLAFTTDLISGNFPDYLKSMIIQSRKDVYAILGNNIYKSIDNGIKWTAFKQNCSTLAIDEKNQKVIYTSCLSYYYPHNGIYKSIDGGFTWHMVLHTKATITTLNIDKNNSQIIYAGNLEHGIFQSMDGGKQWHTLKDGLPLNVALNFSWDIPPLKTYNGYIQALAIDPISSCIIYVGTLMGIYKSTDCGLKWNKSDKELPFYHISALAINFKNSNIIYAGTNVDGIFRSIDGGENWQPVNTGILCQGRALLPSK